MISIIIFIIILGILILAHEWGHFISARRAGLKVEEFGFGFPPSLFKFKKGDTVYSINLIPFGGFVKILGEDGTSPSAPESFASKSPGVKSRIIASGVAMNFLLALILIIIGFNVGLPSAVDETNQAFAHDIKIQVGLVASNSPAAKAGIKIGDAIYAVDKIPVAEVSILQDYIKTKLGQDVVLGIKRGSENFELQVQPRLQPPQGEGPLGIALVKTGIIRYPWYKSVWLGLKSTVILTYAILEGFWGLLTGLVSTGHIAGEISGPVGIAVLTTQAVNLGFAYVLQLVVLLSLNLAILNLLPFPALDGGRLLFLAIEKIKGSPVSPKIENAFHLVGLVLLLTLAVFVTWQDILKLR